MYRLHLEEPIGNLSAERCGRLLGRFGLFVSRNARDEIHLLRFPYLGLHDDLVAYIKNDKDGDIDVAGEEFRGTEFPKDSEAGDEHESKRPEHAPVREERLQRAVVRVFCSIDALRFHSAVEEDEGEVCSKPT